ncbi:5-amino-6-(5-phospho-D-ribitylamino)uracil phosphatase YigB [Psychromonas sp. CD1]|uniref:5-amino-6-(5-phospho-D-ribitylamino)uracil phosphatase YigB n=1 Tax=Psychromonas sp. CD1 TaxID=1979839 RepID=UPI000B9A52B8|nr:5-amino-6-(5-phospho-D-ribitylamino)uracil phosphatase YigB [Psychromonas sp. CD1]
MKFYRALKPFKAISFDLDDTLYDNHPIIKKAESDFLLYLNKTYAQLSELTAHQWGLYKNHLLREYPQLIHDVSQWRLETLKRIMCIYGITEYIAIDSAQQALTEFLRLRSAFKVPQKSLDLLDRLAQQYPVIAITNGNVDTHQIGLDNKFKFVLKAGNGYQAKPSADLFIEAAQRLNIAVSEIIHVGDHLISDVFGAQNSGAQAVWLNENKQSLAGARLLPTVEITQLDQLYSLLTK